MMHARCVCVLNVNVYVFKITNLCCRDSKESREAKETQEYRVTRYVCGV